VGGNPPLGVPQLGCVSRLTPPREGAGIDGACRANLCCPLYVDRSAKKCPFRGQKLT